MDLNGANRRQVFSNDSIGAIAFDDQAAYMAETSLEHPLDRVDLQTKASAVLAKFDVQFAIALGGGGYVYVLGAELGRLPVMGGPFSRPFPTISSGMRAHLVADDDWVYFAPSHEVAMGWCAGPAIGKIRADLTGATLKLVDEVRCIAEMVQDARALYWMTRDGAISKVAK
jgi:hypothetical protein